MDTGNVTDAFVETSLDDLKIASTHCIVDDLEPKWNESYSLDVCHYVEKVCFQVNDEESIGHEKIGTVKFKAIDLQDGEKREADRGYPIQGKSKGRRREQGRLFLTIQYIPDSQNEDLSYDIESYFPAQRNCRVTLYQDAHAPDEKFACPHEEDTSNSDDDEEKEEKEEEGMKMLSHNSCWKDVYSALIQAEELICITGWSVWTELKLLRGKEQNKDQRTLGQILVDKACRGTRVYVMVWDEKMTGGIAGSTGLGVMGTHDEETCSFFKNTGNLNFYLEMVLYFQHYTRKDIALSLYYLNLTFKMFNVSRLLVEILQIVRKNESMSVIGRILRPHLILIIKNQLSAMHRQLQLMDHVV